MPLKHKILRPFRRFAEDDRASITVEAVMIFPLLMWGYFGMFILFDAYKALASNIRVGYTISDMLSREINGVDAAYIEGLNDIQGVLTQSPHRVVLRVTVVSYFDTNGNGTIDAGEHSFKWSYSTAGQDDITAADFETAIVPYLPPMASASQLIVVETWLAFVPFMNMTLEQLYGDPGSVPETVFGPFYFENLVAVRPRFGGGQLCWETCIGA